MEFTYSLPDVTISIEKNQNITIYGDIVLWANSKKSLENMRSITWPWYWSCVMWRAMWSNWWAARPEIICWDFWHWILTGYCTGRSGVWWPGWLFRRTAWIFLRSLCCCSIIIWEQHWSGPGEPTVTTSIFFPVCCSRLPAASCAWEFFTCSPEVWQRRPHPWYFTAGPMRSAPTISTCPSFWRLPQRIRICRYCWCSWSLWR